MKISRLIKELEEVRENCGEITVCLYNECHERPCESIVPQLVIDGFYVNFCEDEILQGDFLLLR